ncbi:uncharacterized protein clnk [Pundamilia nyererei]|uniref:Uncharacterized protein clnk n=1 Tax=Pundamilia nyererei TaxID=303518 RepID=A0A9Y6SMK8_9CICH|nr:PREDICTED: uncharacterized protein LOC102209309 [Pundamilia nyererei]
MDRSRAERNRTQRYANDVEEPEYDVVDNQEEVLSVRILPARPINDDQEYADRDLPRSSSAHNLSSLSPGNSNILPRCPPRETPFSTAPVINRDLKPGRQKMKTVTDRRIPPVPKGDQHSQRSLQSPSPFTLELVNVLSGKAPQQGCRRDREHGTTRNAEFSSHMKGPLSSESLTHGSYRHSLDLESHLERRTHQSLERVPSKRHHHEWPQTKEDFDQHDFVPMEKPQQVHVLLQSSPPAPKWMRIMWLKGRCGQSASYKNNWLCCVELRGHRPSSNNHPDYLLISSTSLTFLVQYPALQASSQV